MHNLKNYFCSIILAVFLVHCGPAQMGCLQYLVNFSAFTSILLWKISFLNLDRLKLSIGRIWSFNPLKLSPAAHPPMFSKKTQIQLSAHKEKFTCLCQAEPFSHKSQLLEACSSGPRVIAELWAVCSIPLIIVSRSLCYVVSMRRSLQAVEKMERWPCVERSHHRHCWCCSATCMHSVGQHR